MANLDPQIQQRFFYKVNFHSISGFARTEEVTYFPLFTQFVSNQVQWFQNNIDVEKEQSLRDSFLIDYML